MQIPCDSAREIGKALSIGLKYRGWYESEHNLTQKLLNELDSSYIKINSLVKDLNTKPTEVTKWSSVWISSAVTTVIVSVLYLIIYSKYK